MFDTYSEIFARRGHAYHQAMTQFPLARKEEFDEVLACAAIKPGDYVCDAPSGGGYLHNYLTKKSTMIVSVDSADQFIAHYAENPEIHGVCSALERLALATESMNSVVSLAGLHHLPDRKLFYREAFRILKSDGTICIADVAEGSGVGHFLNIFVDQHNSMGHRGDFFTASDGNELANCGFNLVECFQKQYFWRFDNEKNMVRYCRLMFGLDQTNDEETLEGISHYLGFKHSNGQILMNWELMFLCGKKEMAA